MEKKQNTKVEEFIADWMLDDDMKYLQRMEDLIIVANETGRQDLIAGYEKNINDYEFRESI